MKNDKITKLVIYDEVNVQFTGLDFYTIRMLMERFSFKEVMYYRIKYQKKPKADTKIVEFFKRNGQTYFSLLDDIIDIIKDRGYRIVVEDRRKSYDFDFKPINENFFADMNVTWKYDDALKGQPIILRDYQVKIINRFLKELQSIQEAATGCGKTLIIATLSYLASRYGKVVIIVPNVNLVSQTKRYFDEIGIEAGRLCGNIKEYDKKCIISTWQSINSISKNKKSGENEKIYRSITEDVVAVIVDECHSSRGNVLRNILCKMYRNVPIRWGLTATVPKKDIEYYSIITSIGRLTGSLKAKSLQEKGVLSKCKINIFQFEDDGEFDDYMNEKKYLLGDRERMEKITEIIKNISLSGNTLVLVDMVETAKYIHEILDDSFLVYGEIKAEERDAIYDYVKDDNNKIIVATYGVASVGIDIPRLFNVVLIEVGKSIIRVLQSIGRGMRKAFDKNEVTIYDICSTLKYSNKHLKERIRIYKNSEYPYEILKVKWK